MAGVLPPVLGSNLRLHGAACAALAPNACVVHHLGASQLSFDSTIGAAKMAVRFRESLEARLWPGGLVADALCAEVWPDDSATPPPGAALLTLGHQQDAHGAMPCPATASLSQPPTPRLAAVALVVDSERRCILLTRRPRAMRTFPGAWVLPGGSVDAADGSTAAAALRELAEETGLAPAVDAAAGADAGADAGAAAGADAGAAAGADAAAPLAPPFCLWESCYPPSAELWRERQSAGGRCSHVRLVY